MANPPKKAGLGTAEVESLLFEAFELLDPELLIEEPRERPFARESFLVFRWPLVSRVGSFHDTSNMLY